MAFLGVAGTRDSSDFEPSTIPEGPFGEDDADWAPHALDTHRTPAPGTELERSGTRGSESRDLRWQAETRELSGVEQHDPGETTDGPHPAATQTSPAPLDPWARERPDAPVSDTPSTQSLTSSALELPTDLSEPASNQNTRARMASAQASPTLISQSSSGARLAHTTMQSVARPGPPPSQSWDERRVVHLERELDQLVVLTKLLGKREKALTRQLRWQTGALIALAVACLLGWLL